MITQRLNPYIKTAIRTYYNWIEAVSFRLTKFNSPLYNKVGVTFGDSNTFYDGKFFSKTHTQRGRYVFGYQYYLRKRLGCKIINMGNTGWDLTQIQNTIKAFDFSNIDFVIINSGTNDHRIGINPGVIMPVGLEYDLKSTSGALQSSIEHIQAQDRDIKIYLATPIVGYFYESGTKPVPGPYKKEKVLSRDYADVFLNAGDLYNLTVCNWHDNIMINESNKTKMLGDKKNQAYLVHPTLRGFKQMGEFLADVIVDSWKRVG